jgi:hypothetical protein
MKITRHTDMIVNGSPLHSWYESADGDHVPLPLDASAVPDAVVEKVAQGIEGAYTAWVAGDDDMGLGVALSRAAIAALAQALGEEG